MSCVHRKGRMNLGKASTCLNSMQMQNQEDYQDKAEIHAALSYRNRFLCYEPRKLSRKISLLGKIFMLGQIHDGEKNIYFMSKSRDPQKN